MSNGKDKPKKKANQRSKDKDSKPLKLLSMHPLDMEEALKAFMDVDPEKVEKRLEKEGIKQPKGN